jgi:hypothetical protein
MKKTLDDLGLAATCKTYQDRAMIDFNELPHQERSRNRVHGWNGVGGNTL